MKLYSPKNHRWYDRMIKRGYAEKNEDYYSVFSNGDPSDVFTELLFSKSGKERDVLDIGCGYGKYTKKLSLKYRRIIGLDRSKQSIDYAKSKYNAPNIKYVIADSKKLPFSEGFFDVVFSRLSPHNLDEMYRVLKFGGPAFCMRVGEYDALELRDIFRQKEVVTKMRGYISKSECHSEHVVREWKEAEFLDVTSGEYEYDMHFKTIEDLAKYLSRIPIVPEFDLRKIEHMGKLTEYVKKYGGGGEGENILHRHRYIVQGRKH